MTHQVKDLALSLQWLGLLLWFAFDPWFPEPPQAAGVAKKKKKKKKVDFAELRSDVILTFKEIMD